MEVDELKLSMIQRLMKIDEPSSLEKIEQSIIQEEMQNRLNESLEAIDKGEVVSLEEFTKSNQEWLKKLSTK